MKYYIGIDLGGTNIKAGVVNEEFEIIAKATCKTNLPDLRRRSARIWLRSLWKL